MIEAIGLTKQFNDTTAVRNVSFSVGQGKTLGLIGTSGCGKTTTLRMINRLIEPTSGRVRIDGQEVSQQSPETLRRRIGYVIQNVGLFPHYTVAENVAVVPRLLKFKEREIERRMVELLEMVGLPPGQYASRYPHELSGGQQQRVGFARALAADPPVVLLDEPFGALDQITRSQLQRDFKSLETFLHKTMVLVTHDVFEAVMLCDEICLMDRGEIQQIGTPKDLIFRPQTDWVSDFFGQQRFQLELQVLRLREIVPFLEPCQAKGGQARPVSLETSLFDLLAESGRPASTDLQMAVLDEGGAILMTTNHENLLRASCLARAAAASPA